MKSTRSESAQHNSPKETRDKLDQLDLNCIKVKLMCGREGPGWTREQADLVEVQYKRFLFLNATHAEPIVPTTDVDEFWHTHILDTYKYFEDCDCIFGYYLHHFPYFGMRGEDDARNLLAAFAQTKAIYQAEYGEAYGNASADCENCGNCGASCGVCSGSGSCGGQDVLMNRIRPTLPNALAG